MFRALEQRGVQYQAKAKESLERKTKELQAFSKEHQITVKQPGQSRPLLA